MVLQVQNERAPSVPEAARLPLAMLAVGANNRGACAPAIVMSASTEQ